jgi:hypothetical protein
MADIALIFYKETWDKNVSQDLKKWSFTNTALSM